MDSKTRIKIIEEEIINNILDYLNKGVFFDNKSGDFNTAYSIVYSLLGHRDMECKNYFNIIIKLYTITL